MGVAYPENDDPATIWNTVEGRRESVYSKSLRRLMTRLRIWSSERSWTPPASIMKGHKLSLRYEVLTDRELTKYQYVDSRSFMFLFAGDGGSTTSNRYTGE